MLYPVPFLSLCFVSDNFCFFLVITHVALMLRVGLTFNPLVSRYTCMDRANGDYDIIIRNAFQKNDVISKGYNFGLQVEIKFA